MAARTTVTLGDDINGGPAQETRQFRLGTAGYEIDVNAKNARRFGTQMAPFTDHARTAGRRQSRPARLPCGQREAPRRWVGKRTVMLTPGGSPAGPA